MDKEGNEIILVGDANCDFKTTANVNAKQLKFVYSEYQLEQLIKKFTRISVTKTEQRETKISKSLMDHFSTSSSKCILEAERPRNGNGRPLFGEWNKKSKCLAT